MIAQKPTTSPGAARVEQVNPDWPLTLTELGLRDFGTSASMPYTVEHKEMEAIWVWPAGRGAVAAPTTAVQYGYSDPSAGIPASPRKWSR